MIEGTSLISRVGNEVYGGFMPMGAMIARTARVINITAQGDITAFSLSAQGGITTQGGVSAQGDISGRIVYAQSVSAQNSVSGKTVAADTVSTNNVNAQGTVTGNAVTAQTVTALKGITTQATVTAQAVAAQTLTAAQGITTQGSVAAKGLAVNGNAAVTVSCFAGLVPRPHLLRQLGLAAHRPAMQRMQYSMCHAASALLTDGLPPAQLHSELPFPETRARWPPTG